jgi:fumarate hydratase subunit alpha
MREIRYETIVREVAEMCKAANYELGEDVITAFRKALRAERSETARDVLDQLVRNAELAAEMRMPTCQDTGVAVFFVELGADCRVVGGLLQDAICEGVRKGYGEGLLRASMVGHPLRRVNTGDNTPAIIHLELVEGDRLTMHMSAKGGGSENMSALRMLKPADGWDGVKGFVLDTVRKAGPNACPPLVVGIGIGGNFETCAILAKRSLFRPIGERHADPEIAALENELLEEINRLGIGPQGLGGDTTALDVRIETHPCHIAALPVAVNLNCHASRHRTVVL